ncbi:MAG: SWIM zinc finger family protein [Myxococcota bacterium]
MNAAITIDEAMVDSLAPNAAAIKNGRKLVLTGSFVALHRSEDGSLLFGTCLGSGKNPYSCSSDFTQPDKPVHRCNCPSRQFPCKHGLGLLYAYAQGKPFTVAAVPADIETKRSQAEERAAKKKARAAKPRKVNKSALHKKIKAQLGGLDLLEKLTFDLVRRGMGNTSAKTAAQIEAQAKQLGDAFLPGAQAALHAYTMLFSDDEGRFDAELSPAQREAIYGQAFEQLTRLHALTRQGRTYLQNRLEDPELKPDTETTIAAWLGHAWQLVELKEAGLTQVDVELIQLAFHTHDDRARREYIDTGVWMNLSSGQVQLTKTMRPYSAAKFIKSEDSFFQVAQVPELCVYPGDVNPRVRWDSMVPRPTTSADYAKVRSLAVRSVLATIKQVKASLRAPLANQNPIHVVQFKQIGRVHDDLMLEDHEGARIGLTDAGMRQEPASCHLLSLLPASLLTDQTMVCRFRNDLDSRQLRIKPLAIVTPTEIVRLTF